MSITVRLFPDPVLSTVSRPVTDAEHEDVVKLALQAKALMIKKKGIGLAANQVGDTRRWFAWTFGDMCINPTFTPVGSKVSGIEGCLSRPGDLHTVGRYEEIDAEWTDRKGKKMNKRLKGTPSRAFQHEVDHLDGINIWEKGVPVK